MGAEKHADRPGRGGGREMGLDPAAIRRRGRRERLLQLVRGQGPRPRGGQTIPNATILVAIRLAMGMRSGRTFGEVTQEIRSDLPSLQEALAMPSPEKRQKPKKSPNSGGNPGNPRKWAKTEDTEQPKGKGKGKTGKPKGGDRRNQGGQDSQEDWGDWSWNQSSGARTRALANNGPGTAKKEDRPERARGTARALARGRAARRGARPPAQKGERLAFQGHGREAGGDITKNDPKKVAATIQRRTQTKSARTSPRLGPGRATKAQGDASSPSPPSSCRRSLTTSRASTPPPSSRTFS